MGAATTFEKINESKMSMDHIYDRLDPRAYFRELSKLHYVIPNTAKPVFQKLIGQLQKKREDETIHVLDIGCSYGINAAILKHDLSMPDLYRHWADKELAQATPEQVKEYDEAFFAQLEAPENIEVIGLDAAENAVTFAKDVGLLDAALAINLEVEPLPKAAAQTLAQVDLVTSTGCVGYVTEKSFERLLPAITQGTKPWIANFVLRMFPFDAIAHTLSDWGYVTEKLEGQTFVQREFASSDEQDQIIEKLREKGIDPAGKEAEGELVAEFYLSRPKNDVAEAPLEVLLSS